MRVSTGGDREREESRQREQGTPTVKGREYHDVSRLSIRSSMTCINTAPSSFPLFPLSLSLVPLSLPRHTQIRISFVFSDISTMAKMPLRKGGKEAESGEGEREGRG